MIQSGAMEELKYWVGFSLIPGVGRARFALLEGYFGSLERAWLSSPAELRAAGLDSRTVSAVGVFRLRIDLDREMERLHRHRVAALTWRDPAYPRRLQEVDDRPPLLYVRGRLEEEDEWAVAVVGTRRATVYGKQAAETIAADLARNRVTVVSGLAKGIDAVAHRAALEAGGRTIAVMGCGLDMVYPADHLKLAQAIMERGALVSEYPLGTKPKAEHFPRRNRIMSGLSLGVLVVEAGDTSGALITANLALEQNRDVFAVPGSIFSSVCRGTHRLIQDGAKLVRDAKDILEELNLTAAAQQLELKEMVPVTDTEAILLKHLSTQPTPIDEVGIQSGLPMPAISSALALLELKGLVRQVGGMNYVLAREAQAPAW